LTRFFASSRVRAFCGVGEVEFAFDTSCSGTGGKVVPIAEVGVRDVLGVEADGILEKFIPEVPPEEWEEETVFPRGRVSVPVPVITEGGG
jgi:hypothetical protein